MKQISTFIEELLYRHPCVVVPGWGAFVSERKSAFLTREGVFMPPSKELIFNTNLKTNDGLLIGHIASESRISYEQAQAQVGDFVISCRKKLSQGETLELENIGYFKQEGDTVLFEASNRKNFLLEAYGMSEFVPRTINKIVDIQNIASDKVKDKPTVRWKGYMQYAAVWILGLLALSSGGLSYVDYRNIERNAVVYQQQSQQKRLRIGEAAFLSDVSLKVPPITLNVKIEDVKEQQVSSEQKVETSEVTHLQTRRFYVIAGAFKSFENAQKKRNDLINSGYKSEMAGQNRIGLYQVSYQSFQTRKEAERFSQQLRQQKGLDNWILEGKSQK